MAPALDLLLIKKDHEVQVETPLGKDALDLLIRHLDTVCVHKGAECPTGWAPNNPCRLPLADHLKSFHPVLLEREVPWLPIRFTGSEVKSHVT